MKTLTLVSCILLGPATMLIQAKDQLTLLKERCAEQERQIRSLELKVEQLQQPSSSLKKAQSLTSSLETKQNTPAVSTQDPLAIYQVKSGDNLSEIAREHHTTVSKLISINGLNSAHHLKLGQKLNLPSGAAKKFPEKKELTQKEATPTPAPQSSIKTKNYKIKSGDTFYGIARQHSISIAQLQSINPNLKPTRLKVGQSIQITGTVKTSKKKTQTQSILNSKIPDTNADTPAQHENIGHTENASELKIVMTDRVMTFSEFANSHRTSTSDLNSLNGLNLRANTPLAIGSELYVPTL